MRALLFPILLIVAALILVGLAIHYRQKGRQRRAANPPPAEALPPEEPTPETPLVVQHTSTSVTVNGVPVTEEAAVQQIQQQFQRAIGNMSGRISNLSTAMRTFGEFSQTTSRAMAEATGPGAQAINDATRFAAWGVPPERILDLPRAACIAHLRGHDLLTAQQVRELGRNTADNNDWAPMVRSLIPICARSIPQVMQGQATRPAPQPAPSPKPTEVPDEKRPSRFQREDPL
jgi:hypothetical protein